MPLSSYDGKQDVSLFSSFFPPLSPPLSVFVFECSSLCLSLPAMRSGMPLDFGVYDSPSLPSPPVFFRCFSASVSLPAMGSGM